MANVKVKVSFTLEWDGDALSEEDLLNNEGFMDKVQERALESIEVLSADWDEEEEEEDEDDDQ